MTTFLKNANSPDTRVIIVGRPKPGYVTVVAAGDTSSAPQVTVRADLIRYEDDAPRSAYEVAKADAYRAGLLKVIAAFEDATLSEPKALLAMKQAAANALAAGDPL